MDILDILISASFWTAAIRIASPLIFAALGENGISIRMISQGPEELNIIVGVDNADFEKTVRVLYESFVR